MHTGHSESRFTLVLGPERLRTERILRSRSNDSARDTDTDADNDGDYCDDNDNDDDNEDDEDNDHELDHVDDKATKMKMIIIGRVYYISGHM